MNCPTCNKEMEKGFVLSSYGGLPWIPADCKPPRFGYTNRSITERGGIMLAPTSATTITMLKRRTWVCKQCKMAVLDFAEGDTTLSAT